MFESSSHRAGRGGGATGRDPQIGRLLFVGALLLLPIPIRLTAQQNDTLQPGNGSYVSVHSTFEIIPATRIDGFGISAGAVVGDVLTIGIESDAGLAPVNGESAVSMRSAANIETKLLSQRPGLPFSLYIGGSYGLVRVRGDALDAADTTLTGSVFDLHTGFSHVASLGRLVLFASVQATAAAGTMTTETVDDTSGEIVITDRESIDTISATAILALLVDLQADGGRARLGVSCTVDDGGLVRIGPSLAFSAATTRT